jgi:hypothetical protein
VREIISLIGTHTAMGKDGNSQGLSKLVSERDYLVIRNYQMFCHTLQSRLYLVFNNCLCVISIVLCGVSMLEELPIINNTVDYSF